MNFNVASNLPFCSLFVFFNFGFGISPAGATKNCEGFGECVIFSGYTCKNNKCVCDPDEPGLFRCIHTVCSRAIKGKIAIEAAKRIVNSIVSTVPKFYGERCNSDQECQLGDYNLQCLKSDIRICKCKRGYIWDLERKKCLPALDDDMYTGRFDPVRDLIIPGLIVMSIGAMVYLGFKLFCNCGKLWRRRRHQEIARELEEINAAGPHHQQAWIASYRVFSPYNDSNRSSSALSPTSFPLHPTPCMGLFVPNPSLTQSPPTYEEALKHKVILSSYHGSGSPVVSAYTLPTPEVHRQYHQTLSPNNSASSSIILNPTVPTTPSALKATSVSGHRSFPVAQGEAYGILPLSNDWTQIQYPGTTGQVRNTHNPSPSGCSGQDITQSGESTENVSQHSRVSPIEVWTPHQRHFQTQPRAGIHRPGHPQKIYHGSDVPRSVQNNQRNC